MLSAPPNARGRTPGHIFPPAGESQPWHPPNPLPHSPPSSPPFPAPESLPAPSGCRGVRRLGGAGRCRGISRGSVRPSVSRSGGAVGLSVYPSWAVLLPGLSVLRASHPRRVCLSSWLYVRTPLAVGVSVHFPRCPFTGLSLCPWESLPTHRCPSVRRDACPSSGFCLPTGVSIYLMWCPCVRWGVCLSFWVSVYQGVYLCFRVSVGTSVCPSGY